MALKLAMPDRPVVGVVSDGAAMYTISALWTAAHHRIPVTWVICNNASYRILKLNVEATWATEPANREFVAMDLTDPPRCASTARRVDGRPRGAGRAPG